MIENSFIVRNLETFLTLLKYMGVMPKNPDYFWNYIIEWFSHSQKLLTIELNIEGYSELFGLYQIDVQKYDNIYVFEFSDDANCAALHELMQEALLKANIPSPYFQDAK